LTYIDRQAADSISELTSFVVAALLASSECTRSLVERFELKCRFVVRIGCFPPVTDSPVADPTSTTLSWQMRKIGAL